MIGEWVAERFLDLKAARVVLAYRIKRRMALMPWRRTFALCIFIASGIALVVSGLLSVDYTARAFPSLLSGILLMLFGAILWNLEGD